MEVCLRSYEQPGYIADLRRFGQELQQFIRPRVVWENQSQVSVDIADISLNADRFADVPMGFLPIMTIWTEDENGDIDDILDLPVRVSNTQLQVWIDGGTVDVSSGYITIDGGYVSIEN